MAFGISKLKRRLHRLVDKMHLVGNHMLWVIYGTHYPGTLSASQKNDGLNKRGLYNSGIGLNRQAGECVSHIFERNSKVIKQMPEVHEMMKHENNIGNKCGIHPLIVFVMYVPPTS